MRSQDGAAAEERAARYLQNSGCEILDRNFRSRFGEVDIVARDGDSVVFVEVRFRSRADFGGAAASILADKRRRIIKTALYYIRSRGLDECSLRFDVVAVDGGVMTHIQGAFTAD